VTSPAAGTAALAPGARLGPYEVLAPIGAGGMGEVYRARDARLGRDVAIKVIAFDASSDPERLRRFEQEARTVAALNHPSILSVYDVGTEVGAPYVVFELLEGESLRQRLGREAVAARRAVDWAAQIGRGLAAAHDRGIVHRDLKPENLFLTKDGRVKILDFGLAKLLLGEETAEEGGDSPTLSAQTNPGTLLGTVGYMSPEQVRGLAVDARSDIFSLGAVLYEMLSGRRAFRGNTAADTLTAILKEDPPALGTALDSGVSPALARIVGRCLEKAPEERFQSARDLAFDLEAFSGLSGPGVTSPPRLPWRPRPGQILVAIVVLGAMAAVFLVGRRAGFVAGERMQPTTRGEVRFQLTPPASLRRVSGTRLSPNGTHLAFVGIGSDGKSQLWVHSLSALEARPLPGTEDVRGTPFWSPDSRSIAFFTLDKLKRIDVSSGAPQMICEVPSAYATNSGAWSREGVVILTSGGVGALYRASISGGEATPLTRLDETRRERGHQAPQFLPDGRHFIYYVRSEDAAHRGVRLGSLDSAETQLLLPGEQPAIYAWPGYLFVRRGGALVAHPFDDRHMALLGEPFVVSEVVDAGGFSASETGVLAFASSPPQTAQPTWFDRSGRSLGTVGEPGPYLQIALSPDERHAALQRLDPRLQTWDIWLLDVAHGVLSRFTSDPGYESDPVWSPDGRRLAFTARGAGEPQLTLFQKALGGGPAERVLPESVDWDFVEDWSPDGRFLLYGTGIGGRDGLWAVPLFGERKPFRLVEGPVGNDEPQVSPDGRFLAYMAYEAGRFEVYVQAFPSGGPRARFSTEGGQVPRWTSGGRELIYLTPEGTLMAVDVKARAALEPGVPRKLFAPGLTPALSDHYAVTADGQRFLVLMPVDTAPTTITVVLNWTAGLEK
jgi:serine/threonine protein kinase